MMVKIERRRYFGLQWYPSPTPHLLVNVLIYGLSESLLGDGSDDGVHLFAVLEYHDSWDGPDAVLRGDGWGLVCVQFDGVQLSLIFLRELVHERGYHPARSAPRGPEIDQHRQVRLEHLLLPISVRHGVGLRLRLVRLGPRLDAQVPRPGSLPGTERQTRRRPFERTQLGTLVSPPLASLKPGRRPQRRRHESRVARRRGPLRTRRSRNNSFARH
mmetsp:Transcript_9666/g.27558  ORF Transcript_9666/g.27558 Transcript_9666/m.27558 type:complete len:215 (-) Transcript_9666:103-747(-)